MTWLHLISDRPILDYIMVLSVSAVPLADKAAVLGVPCLHSYENTGNVYMTTDITIVLAIAYFFQEVATWFRTFLLDGQKMQLV